MNDKTLNFNNQALKPLGSHEAEPQADPLAPLKDVLRHYDMANIIKTLGVHDVLDAISAHDIADHVTYIVMKRRDMKEPGSRRMIFRREVLRLAEEIESEW